MVQKIICMILIAAIAAGILFVAIGTISGPDYYIVDKGYALSYIDEYAFVHDDVFWFVLGDHSGELNSITLFVSPNTWYTYSVGERYGGPINNFITYEGDDSIARHLEGVH